AAEASAVVAAGAGGDRPHSSPVITSTANPRVRAIAALSRRSERDQQGLFPVEGVRVIERALAAGWPLDRIVLSPELATAAATDLAGRGGVRVIELGAEAFRRASYRQHPDGILAVAVARPLPLGDLSMAGDGLVLVVEGIEKPGNLGAVLRTADAAGVDAVIAADGATDPFNPNVVRASQGSLFTVPLAVASAQEAANWLTDRRLAVYVAHPDGGDAPWDIDLTVGCAVVVGSEHAGLSPLWEGYPAVTVPMAGAADSLNTATAAAVIAYEARRQQSRGGGVQPHEP
ncbi:MAG: RNA methyltransferase, partial [Acidimicrobiia bacterium]|nr:RNA methyltransferase [Acidimicrobiia bacterium]